MCDALGLGQLGTFLLGAVSHAGVLVGPAVRAALGAKVSDNRVNWVYQDQVDIALNTRSSMSCCLVFTRCTVVHCTVYIACCTCWSKFLGQRQL